jgi:hypothetical protein
MASDTSIDAAVVVTDYRGTAASSKNYHKRGKRVTTNARTLDEPSVWLGILQDWIISARKAGLIVEPLDLRPYQDACTVRIPGVYFCDKCGNFFRGNACGNGCGKDAATS